MGTIVAISGSLRAGSFNTMLLAAAVEVAPGGAAIEAASIAGIPVYNDDDLVRDGPPAVVRALKDRVAAADGLLLASPEYNYGVPGALKNAIDWMSRPAADIAVVFEGCPVGVIGASRGMGGTTLAQTAWLPTFRALGMIPYFGARVLVSRADRAFDADGRLVDVAARAQLVHFMAGFAAFVDRHKRTRAPGSS